MASIQFMLEISYDYVNKLKASFSHLRFLRLTLKSGKIKKYILVVILIIEIKLLVQLCIIYLQHT